MVRFFQFFSQYLTLSRVAAYNAARIYNLTHKQAADMRTAIGWQKSFILTGEVVYDAFFLQALLLDCMHNESILQLPNTASSARLAEALQARNQRFQGPERPLYNHACNLCCKRRIDGENTTQYSAPKSHIIIPT
jgi:hypothetical protein